MKKKRMNTATAALYEHVGLLKNVLKNLRVYGERIGEPGNREFYELSRRTAVDLIWNIEEMIRDLGAKPASH